MEALQARIERALNGDSAFCVMGFRCSRIGGSVGVTDVVIDGGKQCSLGEGELVNLDEAVAVCGLFGQGKLERLKQQFTTNGDLDRDKVAYYMEPEELGELNARIEEVRKMIENAEKLETYAAIRVKARVQWEKETMTHMSYAEARRLRRLDALMKRIERATHELCDLMVEYDVGVQEDDE